MRGRAIRAAALFVAALCACAEPAPLGSTAPADVAWAALVDVDELGVVQRASGIEAWPEGQALPIFAAALSEPLLVAYRDADLARLGVRDDPAGAARERLRAPERCEQPLPSPAWAARWSARGELVALDSEALAEVPALTSSWVTTRCAPLASGALSVDVTCEDRHCAHALRSTGECGFELEFPGCTRAPVAGAIFADGTLCLGPEADAPACPVEAVVPPGEPPFLLDRVELVPTAQERLPDFLTFNGLLIPDVMSEGWAHDLELVGGDVAVVVGDGTFGGPCRGDYSRTVHVELWDPQALTLASTATVPPCLTAIASLGGSGFVGAYSSEGAWRLGKFDVTGRLVASAPIDDRTTRGAGEPRLVTRPGHRVLDVEHLAGAGVVAVLFNLDGDDGKTGDGGNIVFTYDVETLARRGGFDYPDGQRWVMTPVDDRTLALPRNDARRDRVGSTSSPGRCRRPRRFEGSTACSATTHCSTSRSTRARLACSPRGRGTRSSTRSRRAEQRSGARTCSNREGRAGDDDALVPSARR